MDNTNNRINFPKISVIVTLYNMQKYAYRTINSVVTQEYKNLEIILVNDGSTDGTAAICDDFKNKDDRVKVIHRSNGGPSSARNAGLDVITGNYVGFIDGDDIIRPNMYKTLVDNMKGDQLDISEVTYFRFEEEGKPWHIREENDIVKSEGTEILRNFLEGLHYSGSLNFRITKREIIGDMRLDTGLWNNEDALFSYYCLKNATSACYQNISLYGYRDRKGSLSKPIEEPASTVEVAKKICDEAILFNEELIGCAKTYLYNGLVTEIRGMCGSLKNIRKYKGKIKKIEDEAQIILENYDISLTRNKEIERFIIKHFLPLEYYMLKITGR